VITTSDGYYYIVAVEDRKKPSMTPLKMSANQIEQRRSSTSKARSANSNGSTACGRSVYQDVL